MILATQKILFFRNHNFICDKLHGLFPSWDDEKLYQEARRINAAQFQMIIYGHYLRIVLGDHLMDYFELSTLKGDQYTVYNPSLDASTIDEFAAAALRYGHTLVRNYNYESNLNSKGHKRLFLRDYFNYPQAFYEKPFLDRLAKGMTEQYGAKHDDMLGDEIRNYVNPRRNNTEAGGEDLATLSVARGRDHGIPGYTYYLKYFFKEDVTSFCQLNKFLRYNAIEKLLPVYRSVHDVELYVAGLMEDLVPGGKVGPTFAAILITQYRRQKFGDRYYFEHGNEAGSFSKEQLVEIRKTTLAGITCDGTMMHEIQRDVFRKPGKDNPIVPCSEIPRLDFSKFG